MEILQKILSNADDAVNNLQSSVEALEERISKLETNYISLRKSEELIGDALAKSVIKRELGEIQDCLTTLNKTLSSKKVRVRELLYEKKITKRAVVDVCPHTDMKFLFTDCHKGEDIYECLCCGTHC